MTVLDHVEETLNYVPHSRRSGLTLGEFLKTHHWTNPSSLQTVADDVLKRKLQEAIGFSEEDYAMVDWEYGGVRTQPLTH